MRRTTLADLAIGEPTTTTSVRPEKEVHS